MPLSRGNISGSFVFHSSGATLPSAAPEKPGLVQAAALRYLPQLQQ